jgi:putative peptidoglycan lipid II flippase
MSSDRILLETIRMPFSSFRRGTQSSGMPLSVNQKIFRAAAIVGVFSLLAKIGSTGKELVVAWQFGRTDALDAFLIAFLMPSFVVGLVAGSLNAAMIPCIVQTRETHGRMAVQRLLSSIMVLSLALLLAISILLFMLAPLYLRIMGAGFSDSKLTLTRQLLNVLIPIVALSGFAMLWSAVLNAEEQFALPAIAPIITPLWIIAMLYLVGKAWGVFALALGTVFGQATEATMVGWALRSQGLHLRFRWHGVDEHLRSFFVQYAPLLAGTFLVGSSSIIDQSMAAMLKGGSVAALSYANRIVSVVLGIGSAALSTAVFPYFSHMIAKEDWEGCRRTLKTYSILVVATTLPLTVGLILAARPLTKVLYQRGMFSFDDTRTVSLVLVFYLIQIPFYVWGMLFVRFLSALKRNDILMYGALGNLALDIILNLILMRVWDVAGIALSTSLMYVFSFVYLASFTFRYLSKSKDRLSNASGEEVSVETTTR